MTPTILHAAERCLTCEYPISARSADAVRAAIRDHVAFVNATKDKDTDDHFSDMRLNRLVDA